MKYCKIIAVLSIIFIISSQICAQVAISKDGSQADASAMLEVKSTDKGFLMPRLTQTQIENIPNPANGLLLYQTDNIDGLYYNRGNPESPEWVAISSAKIPSNIIMVGPEGDFSTIQEAINSIPIVGYPYENPPILIKVAPGIYNEAPVVGNRKNISIEGSGPKRTIIDMNGTTNMISLGYFELGSKAEIRNLGISLTSDIPNYKSIIEIKEGKIKDVDIYVNGTNPSAIINCIIANYGTIIDNVNILVEGQYFGATGIGYDYDRSYWYDANKYDRKIVNSKIIITGENIAGTAIYSQDSIKVFNSIIKTTGLYSSYGIVTGGNGDHFGHIEIFNSIIYGKSYAIFNEGTDQGTIIVRNSSIEGEDNPLTINGTTIIINSQIIGDYDVDNPNIKTIWCFDENYIPIE